MLIMLRCKYFFYTILTTRNPKKCDNPRFDHIDFSYQGFFCELSERLSVSWRWAGDIWNIFIVKWSIKRQVIQFVQLDCCQYQKVVSWIKILFIAQWAKKSVFTIPFKYLKNFNEKILWSTYFLCSSIEWTFQHFEHLS